MPMTNTSNRRILTFPAIHPCDAVSPGALHALIGLCHDITSHRSDDFPVHRRRARETLRQVGAILEFLEDVRDRGAILPGSVTVSFSELHVTLQKIRHLLHDCARPGARLWVLLLSDRVSCEFQVLVRSIATVLDVLPLETIDAAPEVKEVIRLVRRQAWKVAMGIDPADHRALRSVWSILNQFKKGVAPARSNLKRVLEHLHIRSWTDCHEEVAFLEEEIFASSDDDEIALLASLMGFMVYCRVVLFDTMDGNRSDHKDCNLQPQVIEHLRQEDLWCPISLELMMDPVTVATGQTYDRASIIRWFKAGYLTCPVTGERLDSTELVPNSAIRKLVVQFCHQNNVPITEPSVKRKRDLSKTASPFSPAGAGAIRMVAAFLVDKLSNGTSQEKYKATYEIRKLSKSNVFNRACLVEAGPIPWLLHLLSSTDPSIQKHAVAGLLNLAKHPDGRKAIFETGGLTLVVDVMKMGFKIEAQQNAAAILFYLSSIEEYRIEIGDIPEAIPTLVGLLRDGMYRGKKNALVALLGLLLYHGNHPKVWEAGAIPVLTNLLSSEMEDLVIDSTAVLGKIAERKEGTSAILRYDVIPHVVEVLQSTTSRSGRESCVSILLSLCNNGGTKVVSLLGQMPSLMPSLYSLVIEGSPIAGQKARSLLNHIHSFEEHGYPAIFPSQ
ncbi:U-box domain-containing protein 19 [Elaeis guineensis]|uniref:RING-type E3 ubiquitin transferase n=1 Tax=Elaeis guineensis var. tenera TaxID=51953 RepID=A0A6I9QUK6_ELAGV|nr:U-box domain-containing protein 19 [Elaeis guineensis]